MKPRESALDQILRYVCYGVRDIILIGFGILLGVLGAAMGAGR